MKRFQKGFTLAETLIVITVLGIIATLTIPALVNKNKESVAKTKLRKAMAAYESALNKMIIENDLRSDETLTSWAGNANDNCANSTQYFKKTKDVNGCIFKTSDGIWWNISNIERPVISFKEITNSNKDTITTNANNENDKTAFVLVGRFGTDGSLRVDDLAYETGNSVKDNNNYESKAQVEKLYSLFGIKTSSSSSQETCDIICQSKRGDTLPICSDELKNCATACADSGESTCYLYDNEGNQVATIDTYVYVWGEVGEIFYYNDGSEFDISRINGNVLETNLYTTDGMHVCRRYKIDDSGNSILECEYNQDYNTNTATVLYEEEENPCSIEW